MEGQYSVWLQCFKFYILKNTNLVALKQHIIYGGEPITIQA